MIQNNVHIFGGLIQSKPNKPLMLGEDKPESRIKEIYTKNLSVTGTVDIRSSEDSAPLVSISDNTCFMKSESIVIEGNIELEGTIKINGKSLSNNKKSMIYATHNLTNDELIQNEFNINIGPERYHIFNYTDGNDLEVNITFQQKENLEKCLYKKTFISKKGFCGTLKFNFVHSTLVIPMCLTKTIQIGFSDEGQCIDFILNHSSDEIYLKNIGYEVF